MRSKNLSCKLHWSLIRKDLTRFWPVWGSYLAIWLMILPIPMLTSYSGTESYSDLVVSIHRLLTRTGGEAALVMAAIYGGLSAFAVWSYLYQSRSASLFHALPVTRETLFCSHFTAGLSFLLLPNVLIAVITYLCQAVLGYFDPTQILCWLAVVCLENFLFFTLGTLAAMCTGSLPAMPVLYGLINFAVVVYESLLQEFATQLYWGVSSLSMKLVWLSPIVQLAQASVYVHESYPVWDTDSFQYTTASIRYYDPEYLTLLCLYALAALVLAACALLLYRRRATESAGDVIAFDFLKPIAKYCFAFGCALVLGWVFDEVVFSHSDGLAAKILCCCVGGAIGYLTAAMLLKKSFRVFRPRELAGLLALWVVVGGLFVAFDSDLFGVESYVPRAGDVVNVKVNSDYLLSLDLPQDIDPVLALHRSIVENKDSLNIDYLRGIDAPYEDTISVGFTYTLEDGTTLRRSYGIPWDTDTVYDLSTPQGRLEAIMNVPQRLVDSYLPPEDATIASMQLQIGDDQLRIKAGDAFTGYGSAYISSDHFNRLLKALEADIRAGRLCAWNRQNLTKDKDYRYLFSIEINYERTIVENTSAEIALIQPEMSVKPVAQTASYWKDIVFYSYDTPTRTLDLLVELGYFTSIPSGYFTEGVVKYE